MLDYNREYDTTQVDTPENRRGMVNILQKYAEYSGGGKPVFEDPEGRDDMAVSLFLRVLADYSDRNSDKPESLETEMAIWEKNMDSDTCFVSFFDHLRYVELTYVSADPSSDAWPAMGDLLLNGEETDALPIFTRRKWIKKEIRDAGLHAHHASIYDLLDVCEAEGVNNILINPDNTDSFFEADNIKASLEEYGEIDNFWENLRRDGVEGEDLFPLLVTDFLYRTVRCVYGDGQEDRGVCVPYAEGHKAPVIFIDTGNHRMACVPLDEIQFIQELPEEGSHKGQDR
ncbi:MAG: hypothetical protein LUD51_05675 [Clostridia bacterium]|nr:hypothetical protein [Clostridia bacterium]